MRNHHHRRALVGVLVGIASLVAASPAAAGVRVADVMVSIEGRQNTEWENHHIAEGRCDVAYDRFGAETVRFRSTPVRLRAVWAPPQPPMLVSTKGTAKLPVRGTVTRSAHEEYGASTDDGNCADGVGDSTPPPAPDCGTKRIRGNVEVDFQASDPELLVISEVNGPTLFKTCPFGDDQYPTLLPYDGRDRRVGQRISARDLFRYGKHVLIAKGVRQRRVPEFRNETDIRWTLTLKRVKRR